MAIDAMTIHYSSKPEALNLSEIFKKDVTILVHFLCIRQIACSSFTSKFFND